jgi:hypothetical protein
MPRFSFFNYLHQSIRIFVFSAFTITFASTASFGDNVSDISSCLENTKGSTFNVKSQLKGDYTFLFGKTVPELRKIIDTCEKALMTGSAPAAVGAGYARALRTETRLTSAPPKEAAVAAAERIARHANLNDPNVWVYRYKILDHAKLSSTPELKRKLVELADSGHDGAIEELMDNYYLGTGGFRKNMGLGNRYATLCIRQDPNPYCFYKFFPSNFRIPSVARAIDNIPADVPTLDLTAYALKAIRAAELCDRSGMVQHLANVSNYQCPDDFCRDRKYYYLITSDLPQYSATTYNNCRRRTGVSRGGAVSAR